MADPLLDDLLDWLRIPSISTGGGEPADLERAADWVVRARGGRRRRRRRWSTPRRATRWPSASCARRATDAPTVLIYGHYDVQSVGDPSAWTLAAVRARRPRRPHLRARRLRRQGQLPAAAARRVRAGARGRAAGQRARARRGRGGGRRRGRRALGARRRARRRLRDRLRLRHGGRAHARDHDRPARARHARTLEVRTARARPALGRVRRQRR